MGLPAQPTFTYNPQGRRDPFMSLIRPAEDSGNKVRKPGIEGFLIDELYLKGIIEHPKHKGTLWGFFQAADGKSYWGGVGTRLFDGEIIAIDKANVTFRQDVTEALSPVRTREKKKSLYASEEAMP